MNVPQCTGMAPAGGGSGSIWKKRLVTSLQAALLLAAILPAALPTPAVAGGGGPFTNFTVSATDVGVGSTVTVTSTTAFDVGPTAYWTQIYDLTTGARVADCGSGTTCTATVNQSTPHFGRYEAWLGGQGASPPPPSSQGATGEMDVAWNAIDVSLSAGNPITLSSTTYAVNLTAVAAQDVGPTPHFIEIFNVTTGAEVAACATGTTCANQTVLSSNGPEYTFQAFVTPLSNTVPTSFQGASAYVFLGGQKG
jgi:hypothetical protein